MTLAVLTLAVGLSTATSVDLPACRPECFSPKTGLYYNCPVRDSEPASSFVAGRRKWSPEFGYGRGMEDCAILTGIALVGAVQRGEASVAEQMARGLVRLSTAHGVSGFVARGLCAEDGRSICTLSSRDQLTHYVDGLLTYVQSPLATVELRGEIAQAMSAVADRLLQNVTEANDWNALTADGEIDPKGILKMWQVKPHEAARLPMAYLAAWKLTGNGRYRKAYEKYADQALEASAGVTTLSAEERKWSMPGYAFLQMNVSLRVIAENDPQRAEKANAVRRELTRLAIDRFLEERGEDGPWLSAGGDLALVVEMNRALGLGVDEVKAKAYETLYAKCVKDLQESKAKIRVARRLSFATAESLR